MYAANVNRKVSHNQTQIFDVRSMSLRMKSVKDTLINATVT